MDWLKESLKQGQERLANMTDERRKQIELTEEWRKATEHHHNYNREPEKL